MMANPPSLGNGLKVGHRAQERGQCRDFSLSPPVTKTMSCLLIFILSFFLSSITNPYFVQTDNVSSLKGTLTSPT